MAAAQHSIAQHSYGDWRGFDGSGTTQHSDGGFVVSDGGFDAAQTQHSDGEIPPSNNLKSEPQLVNAISWCIDGNLEALKIPPALLLSTADLLFLQC
ncbi:hypothetical protein MRB53_005533 [Persea americana]|uniref:Uncharacterized protein n=1 Tax=Persea americana TaxID=3435 RepID=A0ACC2MDT0_PERAE|nr:hypothetical protein MRB53_005533 [Persea americana]